MDISKLMDTLYLGVLLEEPVMITGGLLHKMFRVSTSDGLYAVKLLNPEIMKRPDALSNTIHSEKIAKAFDGLIPAVVSLEIDGKQVHKLGDEYYMVYPWVDGYSVFPGEITAYHCETIGGILGKMHHQDLKVECVKPEENPFEMFAWEAYLKRINDLKNSDKEWIAVYRKSLEDIKGWNQKACDSERYLSKLTVISHRDLDPKNVMWNDDNPYIIDWEAAGYVNPYQEFLEVINYWTDDGAGNLVKEKCDALINAYRGHMDISTVMWDEVFHGSYNGMLGWLEYNVKRALGIEASDEAEMLLGEEQVIGTIRELYSYQGKIRQLREWLGNGKNTV